VGAVAEPPPPAQRRLDDPAWVDEIVSSAVDRVKTGSPSGTLRPQAPPPDDHADVASPPPSPPADGPPRGSVVRKRVVRPAEAKPPRRPPSAVDGNGRGNGSHPPTTEGTGTVGSKRVVKKTVRKVRKVPPSVVPTASDDTVSGASSEAAVLAVAAATEVPRPADAADEEPVVAPARSPNRALLEWGAVILGALLVVLVIKTYFFQAFYIPSDSMAPTLEPSDRVLVNKLSGDDIQELGRGDVIVFHRPAGDESTGSSDLIKRVVALPRESIEVRDNAVFINGEQLAEPYLDEGLQYSDMAPVVVPDGHVFVMGDNRPDSRDSRSFGAIPEEDIVGRAFLLLWPPTRMGPL
jgi:signal peptidase I